MRKFVIIAILALLALPYSSALGAEKSNASRNKEIIKSGKSKYTSDEVMVKFKDGVSEAEMASFGDARGLVDVGRKSLVKGKFGARRFEIGKGGVEEMISSLKQSPLVEYAEPNYVAQAQMVPNDVYYPYQWNLKNMNMEQAWDKSNGQGVVVAVLDTGVAYTTYGAFQQAPDLSGTHFVAGWDFVNEDAYPLDDGGHGTHVAGTIAGATNNNQGVAGIAYGAKIMPVKILDTEGYGTYADIVDGIVWATDHGAKIINLSLGAPDYSEILKDAVKYAYERGVLVVAAAGNSGEGQIYYPAGYDEYVIAVGAVDARNVRAGYSNTGSSLDVMAPGGDTSRDDNGDGYGDGILQQTLRRNWFGQVDTKNFGYYFYYGTSQAAAHVAGVAALLMANGITGVDEVRQRLESTATDLGQSGFDREYGWGMVNPAQALSGTAAQPTPTDGTGGDNSSATDDGNTQNSEPQLDVEIYTADTRGNQKSVFAARERVYLLVEIAFEGKPVKRVNVEAQVDYPNGLGSNSYDGDTNSKGVWKKYLKSYKDKGVYSLAVVIDQAGYEKFEWQGNFEVR